MERSHLLAELLLLSLLGVGHLPGKCCRRQMRCQRLPNLLLLLLMLLLLLLLLLPLLLLLLRCVLEACS